jgi:predicted CopG family antitoxin
MSVYGLCMATKTISVDTEAYERLKEARLDSKESFSKVIKRAKWNRKPKSCGDLIKALPEMPRASEAVIRRLQTAQREDSPPD